MSIEGGRFDFDDGGSYVGEWNEGKAHGLGIATGPDNQGEYSGEWAHGFEQRGVYIWPSGNIYAGTWLKGKRHGEGVQVKGRWLYRGNFTIGFCGRYGVKESLTSCAKYEGSWHLNQFDGFGVETNSDGSTYAGAWSKGMRQGFGVRKSAPYGMAAEQYRTVRAAQSQNSLPSAAGSEVHWRGQGSNSSAGGSATGIIDPDRGRTEDIRSGFVLRASSCPANQVAHKIDDKNTSGGKRKIFKLGLFKSLRKQKSTGDLTSVGLSSSKSMAKQNASQPGSMGNLKASTGTLSNIFRSGGSLRSNLSHISHSGGGGQAYTANRHASAGVTSTANAMMAAQLGRSHPELSSEPFIDILGPNVTEEYSGQWNEDKRSGYGIAERSDGLRYEGEWFNNKKDGYGCTQFPDGRREEGRYKENILVQYLNRKSRLFIIRQSRLRDAVEEAVKKAQEAARETRDKAAQTAYQRAENARQVAVKADAKAKEARVLSEHSRSISHEFDPDFAQLGLMWEKQNPLVRPELFGGSVSDDQIDDPYIHSDQPPIVESYSRSPSENRAMLTPQNSNSLQVSGGSRRGSFRSSFHRKEKGQLSPNTNSGEVSSTQDANQNQTASIKSGYSPNAPVSSNHIDGNTKNPTIIVPKQKTDNFDNMSIASSTGRKMNLASQQQQQLQAFTGSSSQALVKGDHSNVSLHSASRLPTNEPLTIQTNFNEHAIDPIHGSVKLSMQNLQDLSQNLNDPQQMKQIDKASLHSTSRFNSHEQIQMMSNHSNFDTDSLRRTQNFDLESIKSLPINQNNNNICNPISSHGEINHNRYEQLKNLNKYIGRSQPGRPMQRAATSGYTGSLAFQHPHSQYVDQLSQDQLFEPPYKSVLGELSDERRRTLPSIMTETPVKPMSPSIINSLKSRGLPVTIEEAPIDENITYIIDDGIRKRLHTERAYEFPTNEEAEDFVRNNLPSPPSYQMHTKRQNELFGGKQQTTGPRTPAPEKPDYDGDSDLPAIFKTFRLDSELGLGRVKESSMPDLSVIDHSGAISSVTNRMIGSKLVGMTKREVKELSSQRRSEMLKQSERRLRGEIIIRLADVKDWFRRNFVYILLLIINMSLAFLFTSLLMNIVPSLEEDKSQLLPTSGDQKRQQGTVQDQYPSNPFVESTAERITKFGKKLIKKVSKKLKGKK